MPPAQQSPTKPRTVAAQVASHAVGMLAGLPRATTDYTVSRVRIPMQDGLELLADRYAPTTKPVGTVLLRGPYRRGFVSSALSGALYATRGYHVIAQSVRGTFGSGGVFQPIVNEAVDGADTVAWLRRQPWFAGQFATVGASYLGFTQWALLRDPPPELVAAVIVAGPHDFSESSWSTGSFTLNDFLGWSDFIAHQEDRGIRRALRYCASARTRLMRATQELPLGQAGRKLLGTGAPWYESWLEHPHPDDPFWQPMRFTASLDRVGIPVLLITGWQDVFLQQTLEQYRQLRSRDVPVALTVGPWTHSQLGIKGLRGIVGESWDWLNTHLAGGISHRSHPVRAFSTHQGWLDLPDWPPPTSPHVLYLQPHDRLAHPAPATTAAPARFQYDPTNPTPTIGGRLLSSAGGHRRDCALVRRHDVLSFTSEVLDEDLDVLGNPVAELAHTSDNPHVDVFVRVSEVNARGKSRNVSDGYRRLVDAPELIRIELDAVAHRFRVGSRIRLLIAGGCHPRYARNLGTDEPPVTGVAFKPATHAVHFGHSRLVLPVRPPVPSPFE
ncbi:MAG: CocE/NonD family hydrolase [Mycobacteriaceae bacterium]|nr:CocE/NonD family hydrolase [Mycobacteriaceae bacterium]